MHFHIKEGSPKDNILELAKTLPADPGDYRLSPPGYYMTHLLGSNAAAVVRHADCSLYWLCYFQPALWAAFMFIASLD